MTEDEAKSDEVLITAEGIFYLTACAPAAMEGPAVESAVRRQRVAGTSNGWTLSDDPAFHSGQTNPCGCDQEPGRKHWLFAC